MCNQLFLFFINDAEKLSQKNKFSELIHEMSKQDPHKHLRWRALSIIFISSWYEMVKNTNKNQPSTRLNYSFQATLRTKKMEELIYL